MRRERTTGLLRVALVLVLLAMAVPAVADEHAYASELPEQPAPSVYAQAVDIAVVRPLFLVPIVVSGVGCAMGLPVAWFFDSPVQTERICWRDPVAYTFKRPLGRF